MINLFVHPRPGLSLSLAFATRTLAKAREVVCLGWVLPGGSLSIYSEPCPWTVLPPGVPSARSVPRPGYPLPKGRFVHPWPSFLGHFYHDSGIGKEGSIPEKGSARRKSAHLR